MKHTKMQELALERIYRLFEVAEQEMEEHPERSKRYIKLAIEISKKARARFPNELKIRYCKKCNSVLVKGKNAEIRKEGNMTIVKCLECGFERKTGNKNQ